MSCALTNARAVLAGLLLLTATTTSRALEDVVWHPDLGPARKLAAEQGKDLLVDFTGSDWCKYCIQLDREVFTRKAFLDYVPDRFVLVALDFPDPRGDVIKSMPEALQQANWAAKESYGIEGYPTVLLMTPAGEVWGRTGYRSGGAEQYVEHLEELRNDREKVLAAYRGLDDADPARKLDAAYELMPVARGELAQRILRIIREHDEQDSRLVLAQEAVLAYVQRYLSEDPDWDAAYAALERLPQGTPSVRRLAEFHAYRAILLTRLDEDDDEIAAAVAEADRLGMSRDTRAWLDNQLALAR